MNSECEFRVEVDTGPPRVVRVEGEIDIGNSQELARAIAEPAVAGSDGLVLDMSGVTFLDSSGLAVLVNLARDGHAVSVRNPSSIVRRLIEVTGLEEVLPIEP